MGGVLRGIIWLRDGKDEFKRGSMGAKSHLELMGHIGMVAV